MSELKKDRQLWHMLASEDQRQQENIELIASENYASLEVMAAQGSSLTNKYAEGYPHKRYYGGCEWADAVENLAKERAAELFGATHVNVQPHSGSQANQAVYLALLKPQDRILSMALDAGGHLTHGFHLNISGKYYESFHYGVDAHSGLINLEEVRELAFRHRPKLLVAGFSAYSRFIDWAKFRQIADEVGAFLWVDMAHVAGLVAAGLYPNPLPHAHVVTTTTHKTLRGPRGGMILTLNQPELAKKLDSAVFPGIQGGPLMHVIAAKAVAFYEASQPSFKLYQEQVVRNAQAMARICVERHVPVVTNGTDNHLALLDLRQHTLTGKRAEQALENAGITVNKNMVPGDHRSAQLTSGIRIGTPAMTTRGMKEAQAEQIAHWMCDVLADPDNLSLQQHIVGLVQKLCQEFPVYV